MKLTALANGAVKYGVRRLLNRNSAASITLLLTLRCNCTCDYCDFSQSTDDREMSTMQLFNLLSQLKQHGTLRLSISGGEPLLRDDFGKIAQQANSKGFITSLVTNGVLLDHYLDEVLDFDYILCTIEGNEQVTDAQRGIGTWKAVTTALCGLAAKGHRKLGIIVPVHDKNLNILKEPILLARELGAQLFYQPIQQRRGWSKAPIKNRPSTEAIRDGFVQIKRMKQAGAPIGNSMRALDMVIEDTAEKHSRTCYAGRHFHTILPNGKLVPCCMVPFEGLSVADDFNGVVAGSRKPICSGCTILPYMENTALLRPHLKTVWNALRW